jgi:hypothetical protein
MHARRRLGVWRLHQAEHLAALLIDPVLEVVDPVPVLGPDVGGMAWATSLAVAPSGRLSCTSMNSGITRPPVASPALYVANGAA